MYDESFALSGKFGTLGLVRDIVGGVGLATIGAGAGSIDTASGCGGAGVSMGAGVAGTGGDGVTISLMGTMSRSANVSCRLSCGAI